MIDFEKIRLTKDWPNNLIEIARETILENSKNYNHPYYDLTEESIKAIKEYSPNMTDFDNAIYRVYDREKIITVGHYFKYKMSISMIAANAGWSEELANKKINDVIKLIGGIGMANALFKSDMKLVKHDIYQHTKLSDLYYKVSIPDDIFKITWKSAVNPLRMDSNDYSCRGTMRMLDDNGYNPMDMTVGDFVRLPLDIINSIVGFGPKKTLMVGKILMENGIDIPYITNQTDLETWVFNITGTKYPMNSIYK